MNGIENISAKITEQANKKAEEILAQAKAQSEQILADAQAQADAEADSATKTADSRAQDVLTKAVLSAGIESRKRLSAERQRIISIAFDRALDTLSQLTGVKYIALLTRLVQDACSDGLGGELLLNEEDRRKYGSKVIKAAEVKGLVLSKETAPIKGGLIIKRGNIELNCALEVLVRILEEEMAPEVSKALFGEGV